MIKKDWNKTKAQFIVRIVLS